MKSKAKTRILSVRSALLYMAEKWEKPLFSQGGIPYVEVTGSLPHPRSAVSLCYTLAIMQRAGFISKRTAKRIEMLMLAYCPARGKREGVRCYWWSGTRSGARARARFCRKLVAIIDKGKKP